MANRMKRWFLGGGWQWVLIVAMLTFVMVFPGNMLVRAGKLTAEPTPVSEVIAVPSQQENRELTSGMVGITGVMLLIVVAGTLAVLRIDKASRPHLLEKAPKRGLPDATGKKTPQVQ